MYNYQLDQMESGKKGKMNAGLVIDVGYSFSHVAPFFDSHLLNYGVKR